MAFTIPADRAPVQVTLQTTVTEVHDESGADEKGAAWLIATSSAMTSSDYIYVVRGTTLSDGDAVPTNGVHVIRYEDLGRPHPVRFGERLLLAASGSFAANVELRA